MKRELRSVHHFGAYVGRLDENSYSLTGVALLPLKPYSLQIHAVSMNGYSCLLHVCFMADAFNRVRSIRCVFCWSKTNRRYPDLWNEV